jgi:hypothetical protein
MENKELKVMSYIDGNVLLAQIEDHLQRLLYEFKLSATKYNTNISVDETKFLTVPKEPTRIKLEVQGKLI